MADVTIGLSTTSRTTPVARTAGTLAFAITVFLGAFLLFSVQLVLARFFLPWFGGAPAVWTTCMFFFQILLLAGYAYAHFLTTRLAPRKQSTTHSLLLLFAVGFLVWLGLIWYSPLTPDGSWKPTGNQL